MGSSPARAARRHGLPATGLGGEIVHDAITDTQHAFKGARGVRPAKIVGVEQVQVLGGGHQVLVTIETPEGREALTFEAENVAPAARRIAELAGDAERGLFVP